MIWITFGWSSGWGQVKSGQTRLNFEVGLFKENWCLSDSVFDGEFNGGIVIFVNGLELQKLQLKLCLSDLVYDGEFNGGIYCFRRWPRSSKNCNLKIVICSFRVFGGGPFCDQKFKDWLKIGHGYSKY